MAAKIAIATSVFLQPTNHNPVLYCGIVKWCRDATQFAALPFFRGRAEAVSWTNQPTIVRTECPQPALRVIAYDPQFAELAWRFAHDVFDRKLERERHRKAGQWYLLDAGFAGATLAKWDIVRQTQYEAILLTDIDVDLFFASRRIGLQEYLARAQRAWTAGYQRFMRSDALVLASHDALVPINAGVVLLKPTKHHFELGAGLLRSMRFNLTHGFAYMGRPRDLLSPADVRLYNATMMVRTNSWNTVGGAADQGLLAAVYTMLDKRHMPAIDPKYHVHHFWASSKPWVRRASCLEYFKQLGLVGERADGSPRMLERSETTIPDTACFALLREKAAMAIDLGPGHWKCRGQFFRVF